MRRNSLAFRLIASSAIWSLLVLVIMGIFLSSLFRTSVERSFDGRLSVNLTALLASIEFRDGELIETESFSDAKYRRPFEGWYWQVRSVDLESSLGLRSNSLADNWLPLQEEHFTDTTLDNETRFYLTGPFGQELRVLEVKLRVPGSQQLLSFAVTGNLDALDEEIAPFDRTMVFALTVLAIGLVLAAFLQVRFGLQPLRELKSGLVKVRTGNADRLYGQYPEEILPVAAELNALLKSNEEIVERARTQVGNLAHALKTPLSVITNEADTNSGEFAHKVSEQADVMRDQISLYLDRARRAARAHVLGSLSDVESTLDGLVRTLKRINADKNIAADVKCVSGLRFSGERQDLEEMVGNLLDNAFKWADGWVGVAATLEPSPDDVGREMLTIIVDDDGPGLAPERRADALRRGRRLDETKPGSGLGLSIVSEIAAMYGGGVSLGVSAVGGLRVELMLPAAPTLTPDVEPDAPQGQAV
jgi:signal transduction histidine kinase